MRRDPGGQRDAWPDPSQGPPVRKQLLEGTAGASSAPAISRLIYSSAA